MRAIMDPRKQKGELLSGIGARVRALRQGGGLTVREIADRATLSPRFINQLEAGEGNISIAGLSRVALALGRVLPDLLPPPASDESLRARTWRLLAECGDQDWQELYQWLEKRIGNTPAPFFVALIGLRGAGKSTIGPLLGKHLKIQFAELDQWVEETAGMPLPEIFRMHGEGYYRRLEREALAKLFATSVSCVFAPGGSIVNDTESWETIKRRCFTVWLHATPQEFMKRMLRVGETRLTQPPTVMADLKALLARREPLYAESQLTIKTTAKSPAAIVSLISRAISEAIAP